MPPWTGFLHRSGAPALKIKIAGAFPDLAQEFDAIVDTGFSGFVSMPLIQAFPLGLTLSGTTSVQLADGSVAGKLTAVGSVIIGQEHQAGIIILEANSTDILLGMGFLQKFGKVLIAHQKRPLMMFLDEADVDVFIDEAVAHAKKILDAHDEAAEHKTQPTKPKKTK